MNRVWMLVVLGVMLTVNSVAGGGYAAWAQRSVVVVDATSAPFAGVVETAVRRWNRVRGGQPTLVYTRGPYTTNCAGLLMQENAIVVCDWDMPSLDCPGTGQAVACTHYDVEEGGANLTSVLVYFSAGALAPEQPTQAIACHEIGHTLGLSHPQQGRSCLSKFRETPGKRDEQALTRLYGKRHNH
jgi:hypothetical protein